MEWDVKTQVWTDYLDPDGEMEIDLYRDDGLVHVITTSASYVDKVLWASTYFGLSRYDGRHIPEPKNIDTVKIGFIGPIIGSVLDSTGGSPKIELKVNQRVIRWDGYRASHLAPIGIKMLQGVQLAVEQANASGGYRGTIPYKLIVRNDNGNWRASGREVIMLVYKDSVWAILGTVDGANSHIAIRVALKAEIPIMNTADTDPTFVETNIPWVFRCITDDRQMCYLLADFVFKKLRLKRIAELRAANRYGRMSIDEFRDGATRLGHPFMVELQYKEGDTDFSRQLKRIQSLNADGVITYGNAKESALILKQMREMGMDQWFFGSDRMVTQEFLDIVGENYGNVAAGYPYDPTGKDQAYSQFIRNYRNRFGEEPETYAAHAYDGMNMIIKAIEKANAAGGLQGVPFRLVKRWAYDPWGAGSTEVIRLVYQDSVWAVIGSLNGDATHIAEQIVTKAWAPLLSPVSADPTLTYIRIPWMFRLPPDDQKQAQVIVNKGIQALSPKRIGLITSADHDGRTFAAAILAKIKAEQTPPVFHFQVSPANVDLKNIVQRTASFKPEGVAIRLPTAGMLDLLDHFQNSGFHIPLFSPWIPGLPEQELTKQYNGDILYVQPFLKAAALTACQLMNCGKDKKSRWI